MKYLALLIIASVVLMGCTVGQAQRRVQTGTLPIVSTGQPQVYSDCVDSDDTLSYGESSYYTSGFAITSMGTVYDRCKENTLVEYFCEYGHMKHEVVTCPFGCFDGACQRGIAALPEVPAEAPISEGPMIPMSQPPSTAPVIY